MHFIILDIQNKRLKYLERIIHTFLKVEIIDKKNDCMHKKIKEPIPTFMHLQH